MEEQLLKDSLLSSLIGERGGEDQGSEAIEEGDGDGGRGTAMVFSGEGDEKPESEGAG